MEVVNHVEENVSTELRWLRDALGRVAGLGRRTSAEIIRKATTDIMLGSKGDYDGLYGRALQIAPAEGEASAEAEARDFRMATNSTSMARGLDKAKSVLGTDKSGVFSVQPGKRVYAPKRVWIRTRGSQRGTATTRKGKTTLAASGRMDGYSTLNLQALAVAYAIAFRESARRSTAVQFLAKRYRTILVRKAGLTYKSGQAVGIASTDAASIHEHRRVEIENKTGTRIGSLEMMLTDDESWSRIRGELGIPDKHSGIVDKVLESVAIDRETYLLRDQAKQLLKKR